MTPQNGYFTPPISPLKGKKQWSNGGQNMWDKWQNESQKACIYSRVVGIWSTPFENAQRWMGKNTFPTLLLNDDNMIGEHQETRMKMPNMCPFEKKEK